MDCTLTLRAIIHGRGPKSLSIGPTDRLFVAGSTTKLLRVTVMSSGTQLAGLYRSWTGFLPLEPDFMLRISTKSENAIAK